MVKKKTKKVKSKPKKEKKMKLGTFHVKKFDVVKVKKADIRNLEENLEKQIK